MWCSCCYALILLLWTSSGGCTGKANMSELIQVTSADFYEKLHSGKMMFIYFELQVRCLPVSPSLALFLVELEKSAEALKDYGVLVGKLNCNREHVHMYCTDHRRAHTAFLFRGGKEFSGFDLDTVFDVNSIVSEVLFAVLRDEVKYVHTDADLVALEKSCRGRKDMVLGYVSSLGSPEHRSMMESAYVYGSKYQFILITGGPVLKHLGVNDASFSSRVWFLHCRLNDGVAVSPRCPLTLMKKHLSTLSLHSFLQLMEAPLVSEVYDDPPLVPPPQFPYQNTPQVFLFAHPATAHLDRDTASALAWNLRGVALVLLVHSRRSAAQTEYNAAYRRPEESLEVKYLTLHSLDELLQLFKDEGQEDEEEEDEEEEGSHHESLDDEISAYVHDKRGEVPDMDSITEITSDNLLTVVSQNPLTVALFYLKWDAVSLTVLSSFIHVAHRLEDLEVDHVLMGAVDCGEWSDLCAHVTSQPITTFPCVLLLRHHQPAQEYRGMLGSEALHRFIMMSVSAAPLLLSTTDSVVSFLQGALVAHRVLGLFLSHTHSDVSVFTEASETLRGDVLTGLLTPQLALTWAADHHVDPPVVLVFPSWRPLSSSSLSISSSADELLESIRAALHPPLPEVTVESLPLLLSQGKAFLMLFLGEDEDAVGQKQNELLLEEMLALVERGAEKMEPYLSCWIHLGHTPAAGDVLAALLGMPPPPLPALVLSHIPSRNEVYQFPPSRHVSASAVLQWLQSVEEGAELPAGMLAEDSWPPAGGFYDFLKVMDSQENISSLEEEEEDDEDEEEKVDVREHLVSKETTDDKRPDTHWEL
ncbi:thioredoxin domain-containing protein 16 isoform X2 [Gouania willdenowi]|uniref:thioredoxin domain-containing protein 16 isoform X2 n=1 Tax=Gouania willdenowi TaxID=441366 RepID=UPI0010547A5F|nr:thioredoxin domain-containing protein 16 isoform X2 [Gouania willdenowi]